MLVINIKKLIILSLSAILLIFGVLIGGCLQPKLSTDYLETQNQIIENITPEEANILIQKNISNKKFVILDVRTHEEFAIEHIEKAVNLDYYSINYFTSFELKIMYIHNLLISFHHFSQ